MSIRPAALALLLLAPACTGGTRAAPDMPPTAAAGPSASPATRPVPSPEPTLPPEAADFLPDPDEPIPTDPGALADALTTVTDALDASIDAWRSGGDPSRGGPPPEVELQALYQQRIYRTLGSKGLRDAVLPLLPQRLRGPAKSTAVAGQRLRSLVTPIAKPSGFETGRAKPADDLLGFFREGQRRFGIDWEVLASLMYVESKFGKVRSTSTAGAQGPMQFLPSTWAAYGLGGDIHDAHDAVLGAANYLRASGAPGDYRKALYAYNHAWPYVDAVLAYAHRMMDDRHTYYAFYAWQVFVLTTSGAVRLTGPGR